MNGRKSLERCTQVLSFVIEVTQETELEQFFARLNSFEHRSRISVGRDFIAASVD
jgi:hypothetical protein